MKCVCSELFFFTKFKCITLWDYVKLYLEIHTLILSDVFEQLCQIVYGLDPAHYCSPFPLLPVYLGMRIICFVKRVLKWPSERGMRSDFTLLKHYAQANNEYVRI